MRLSEKLEHIVGKLQNLQRKLERLEKDKANLQAENDKLKTGLQALQTSKDAAVYNILEHVEKEEQGKEEETRAALDQDIRQQIDHYLSEIDRCIEWLREQ